MNALAGMVQWVKLSLLWIIIAQITCLQVRYEERGAREEEWVSLSKSRFAWQGDLPAGSQSNPTYVAGLTPSGHDAVDHKVCAT